MLLHIQSISQRAAAILRPGVAGKVLASFEHACDLITDAGEVVALVWNGIGDGPLNLVLAGRPDPTPVAGAPFVVVSTSAGQTQLRIGGRPPLEVAFSIAEPWDPRPDWPRLRQRRPQIVAGAGTIARLLADAGWTTARCGLPEALCERAAGGEPEAIGALVGRGSGLTPAGDDWLAGWLLAQYLVRDLRGLRNLEGLIAEAADRTTTLSRALLVCAAAGEADEAWHILLSTLVTDPITRPPVCQSTDSPTYRSAQTILSHGATSGAAMLLGFCAGVSRLLPGSCSLTPDP